MQVKFSHENMPKEFFDIRTFDSAFVIDGNQNLVGFAFKVPLEKNPLVFTMTVDEAEVYAFRLLDVVRQCRKQTIQ